MNSAPVNYSNVLQIKQSGKGIPYGGSGAVREDGGTNYGFKNLKGSPERIAEIPELEGDEALRNLVMSLNRPGSAFATVGCVSGRIDEQQGFRVSGYVEFAFDSADAVTDAASYFPLFFHFDRALHMMKFSDHVHFHWELMGATFLMAKMAGFTVTITVNTGWYPSANEASIAWANGLGFLADYFVQVPPVQGAQLFNVV